MNAVQWSMLFILPAAITVFGVVGGQLTKRRVARRRMTASGESATSPASERTGGGWVLARANERNSRSSPDVWDSHLKDLEGLRNDIASSEHNPRINSISLMKEGVEALIRQAYGNYKLGKNLDVLGDAAPDVHELDVSQENNGLFYLNVVVGGKRVRISEGRSNPAQLSEIIRAIRDARVSPRSTAQ